MEVSAAKNPQNGMTFDKFSKVKFTELKAKFPQKTDKDIFSLVNKQWQTNAKTIMQNSASSAKMERTLIKDDDQFRPKKLEFEQSNQKKEERKKEQIKEESEKFSENSSIKATPIKSIKKKTIQKEIKRPSNYINFYKSYFSKLHEEHPRWTRAQINQIVILLWRRKLLLQNSKKKTKTTPRKSQFKIRSGRKYFGDMKREQGLNTQQIVKLWKSFPVETKKYFSLLGKGMNINSSPAKSTGTTILTFQSKIRPSVSSNFLGFLNKSM